MRKSSKRLYRSKNRTKGRNIKRKTLRTRSKGGGVRKTKRRRSLKQKNKKGGGDLPPPPPPSCEIYNPARRLLNEGLTNDQKNHCNKDKRCSYDIKFKKCVSLDDIKKKFSDRHNQGFFTFAPEKQKAINAALHTIKIPVLKRNDLGVFIKISDVEYNTYFSLENPEKLIYSYVTSAIDFPNPGETIVDDKNTPIQYYTANGVLYVPNFKPQQQPAIFDNGQIPIT